MQSSQVSKFLALILRHHPEIIGVQVDEHGWVEVAALLAGIQQRYPIDYKYLEELVAFDVKGRYEFSPDHQLIRARQGHSIPVDVELETKVPPEFLYHGTATRFQSSIDVIGLTGQGRLYVHLSTSYQAARQVGARHGVPLVYRIATQALLEAGYRFYLSRNGIWLIKAIPRKFMELID